MGEEIGTEQSSGNSRRIQVLAFGNNTYELELYALDEAKKVLMDMRMNVVRNYMINSVLPGSDLANEANGKNYYAMITVQETP